MTRAMTMVEADDLAHHLEDTFSARIVTRTEAPEYVMIRAAVEAATAGAIDLETYFRDFSFTIGNLIYLAPKHTEDSDIMASVMVHECEHVHQFWSQKFDYVWLYIVAGEARVRYEAQAYGAELEWKIARGHPLPTLDSLEWPLDSPAYMLSPNDIRLGREILEVKGTQAIAGVIASVAAQAAIAWAKATAPDLLA